MTAGVAMTVVWKVIFSGDQTGLLNSWLMSLGVLCKDRTRLERVYDCHDRREQHLGFHAGNDYVDHLLEPVLDTVDGSRLIQGFIRIQNTGNQG